MSMPILVLSFLLSILLTTTIQRYFLKNNIIDSIKDRSSHISLATRSGGISIFISIFLVSVLYYIIGYEIYNFSLLIPLSILVLIGLYDDLNDIDYKLKFIFQIIAAKIIIDNGLIIDNLHGVFGLFELNRIFAQALTIFVIVAIINSMNFIDGIDGLAITISILFILSFEFFSNSITPYNNLSQIILSTIVPLYFFNFKKKNKIFLGDSGSQLLGGIVSIYVITILTNEYVIKPEFDMHKIIFVFSILSYPIIDVIRIFFIRLYNKKSPFQADKNHIHHLINNRFNNHFITLTVILVSYFGILSVLQFVC